MALLVYFWRDVLRLIAAGWAAIRERPLADDPDRRLALLLVVSIIPAALVGALFESFFDTYFRDNLMLIPVIMVVGALLLWAAERVGRRDRDLDRANADRRASPSASAQALALFPGISRSGVTIAAGPVPGAHPRDGRPLRVPHGHPHHRRRRRSGRRATSSRTAARG